MQRCKDCVDNYVKHCIVFSGIYQLEFLCLGNGGKIVGLRLEL